MTTDANYMTGRDPDVERRRLASQAALLDDRTFSELTEIGVSEGWGCLELGAGTGTIVQWLLDRVGPTGRVVAIDLDTAALEQIAAPNLEVRSGDAMTMDLGESRFDLVVGRLFFEHVPEREVLMQRCVRALRPGGWLWCHDVDYSQMRMEGSQGIERRWRMLSAEVFPFGPKADPIGVTWAGKLLEAVDGLGLTDVRCYRMERWVPSGAPPTENWRNVWRQRLNQLGELPPGEAGRSRGCDDRLRRRPTARARAGRRQRLGAQAGVTTRSARVGRPVRRNERTMTSGRYLLDKDTGTSDRLDLLASLRDGRTMARLEQLGITEGWECLELGPGTGTVALWMAERVAPSGHVVAIDIDPSKMAGKEHPCLEVQQADLAVADLGTNRFDLISERAVLLWIPEREAILQRTLMALKPGGWILLQDGWPLKEADPSSPAELAKAWGRLYREVDVRQAEVTGMKNIGKDVFGVLRQIGFEDVDAHGELTPIIGGTAQARLRKETLRSSLAGLAAQGLADRAALEPLLDIFDDPRFVLWQAIQMQVWGRKPA